MSLTERKKVINLIMNYETGNNLPISKWAEDDKPREKFLQKGRSALSDAELIAILISTGNTNESAVDVAQKILSSVSNKLSELGKTAVSDLKKIKGVGSVKAIKVLAAIELGRRRKEELVHEKKQIRTSKDIFEYFHPILADSKHEEFWVLYLNRANKIIGSKRISEGGVSGTVVDPKIVFKSAVDELASSIALCHNHPSGNPNPSREDETITQKLKSAGKLLDIGVVDHIIITESSYYSFADQGLV